MMEKTMMIARRNLLLGIAGAALVSARPRFDDSRYPKGDGAELIGRPAPPLELREWIHSRPLDVGDLKGKVALLRWWTEGCPFCQATAPALRKFQAEYQSRGLQVIGIYHPKPPGDWDLRKVDRAAQQKQFTFPVALDGDWSALKRWWLYRDRDFTSVSFLLDRRGIIQYVHPGGEFHEGNQGGFDTHESCQRDFHAIDSEIRRLL